MKRKAAHEWLLLAGALLLIAAVFAFGVLNVGKTWTSLDLTFRDGKTAYDTAQGDAYGKVTDGPYFDLPAGRYRIKWQIEGDGENLIRLACSNGLTITPDVLTTTAGGWEGEGWFEITDTAHAFRVNVEFVDGTWINIRNFRLYSPEYADGAWTFAFVLLGAWLFYVMKRRGALPADRMELLLVLAAAVIASTYPELQANCVMSWDSQFHAARIMNIADGLSSGQFPVRVGGFSYNGYGAATSVFYPDMLLYPFALMVLGGASITYVLHVLCLVVSALSGLTAYYAGRRLLRDRTAAVCTAILYVLSIYRMEDMYRRLMVGEMLAMAFMPVFIVGLYEVIFGDRARWPVLTAGATLIFQSHMCTTLQCACLAAAACVVFAGRLWREKARLSALAIACVSTLAINLTTLVPFVMLYSSGVSTPTMQFGFEEAIMTVAELMSPDGLIGFAMWLGLLAALLALGEEKDRDVRFAVKLFAAVGCIAAAMTTELFPWSYVIKLTGGLVEAIQFPWRLLVIASPLLALCGGYGMAKTAGGRRAMILTLAMAITAGMPYLDSVMKEEVGIEFGQGAKTYMVFPEYQYQGTDVNDTRSRDVILEGGVEMTDYRKDGTQVNVRVEAREDGALTFPLFGFDGYEVRIDGEKTAWTRGENNRLRVEMDAGTAGEMTIRYAGKVIWRAADAVSLLSAAVFAVYLLKKRAWRMT